MCKCTFIWIRVLPVSNPQTRNISRESEESPTTMCSPLSNIRLFQTMKQKKQERIRDIYKNECKRMKLR